MCGEYSFRGRAAPDFHDDAGEDNPRPPVLASRVIHPLLECALAARNLSGLFVDLSAERQLLTNFAGTCIYYRTLKPERQLPQLQAPAPSQSLKRIATILDAAEAATQSRALPQLQPRQPVRNTEPQPQDLVQQVPPDIREEQPRGQQRVIQRNNFPQITDSRTVTYSCSNGAVFKVRYDNGPNTSLSTLIMDGIPELTLTAVVSASGAKYSNGAISWHTKGPDGILTQNNRELVCEERQ